MYARKIQLCQNVKNCPVSHLTFPELSGIITVMTTLSKNYRSANTYFVCKEFQPMQSLLTSLRSRVTRPGSLLIVFGMTLMLLLAACGSGSTAGPSTTPGATSKLTIAFVMGAEA